MALQLLSAPERTYEVDFSDVEYRRDGDRSFLVRIYQPRGEGPFPALIEIHGGAWTSNDRLQNAPLVTELAASGLVVGSVDFRSGSEAPYPASMADISCATRWLKTHAREFNGTAEGLGGLGLSSGGHMVMLSAMRPRDPRYLEHQVTGAADASLAYVMMGWPVIDPYARYLHARQQGRASLLESHHQYFGDEETMREANPQLILERGESVTLPPALIFQGADAAHRRAFRRGLRPCRRHHRARVVPARRPWLLTPRRTECAPHGRRAQVVHPPSAGRARGGLLSVRNGGASSGQA
jgi:acetyl esterase